MREKNYFVLSQNNQKIELSFAHVMLQTIPNLKVSSEIYKRIFILSGLIFYSEAFQTTIAKLGGVDIVINNASIMNDRLWELEVDVNLVNYIR